MIYFYRPPRKLVYVKVGKDNIGARGEVSNEATGPLKGTMKPPELGHGVVRILVIAHTVGLIPFKLLPPV